jgi:hypothetical protein
MHQCRQMLGIAVHKVKWDLDTGGKGVHLLVTYFGKHLMRLLSVCLVLTLLDRSKCDAKLVW